MKKTVLMAITFATMLFGATVEGWTASLVASVDVSSQTMTISQYGRVIYNWPVSTARKGYITPRGNYRPTRLHRMWYSRKYEMSPMPWSVFFRGGYAIHGTNAVKRLGTPASHGCIRLHTANAATFYSLVKQVGPGNTRIVVIN
jgi:lipoprotein-anchoring transpeptidase ErfK/SrfK